MEQKFCDHVFVAGKKKDQLCNRFIRANNETYCYEHKPIRIMNKKLHVEETGYRQKFYQKNKVVIDAKNKEYRNTHKEEKANYDKIYACKHKDHIGERKRTWHREKYNTDDQYKLTNLLRNRISKAIKKGYWSSSTEELVGTDFDEFKAYIECLWEPWMTWDNYGTLPDGTSPPDQVWQFDHILPCISFDLTIPEQQKACFHYSNLQPMSATENATKRDQLEWNNKL
jgi:hypothetical protein